MEYDSVYMDRCIELARNGLGKTAPNPMVGSVIVHNNRIIGEGYHHRYGDHHAEVRAISNVRNRELLKDSTLYVSLEPCCHHGKTPPCTDLILETGIPRVVIGTTDPFDEVAGKGIARLRSNGCEVRVGVLKDKCRALNKRFFTFHEKKRPYVILKWAETADGYIDTARTPGSVNRPTWITSEKLRMLVHKWRTEEASIMVGTQTALKDNPMLNIRDWHGPSPCRLVTDRSLKLPGSLYLMDGSQPTVIFNELKQEQEGQLHYVRIDFREKLTDQIMQYLYAEGIQSLLVEGGRQLLQTFIDDKLWDEARIFTGKQFFGNGVRAPEIRPSRAVSYIPVGTESLYLIFNA